MKRLILLVCVLLLTSTIPAAEEDCWLRGDGDLDGEYTMTDVLMLINFLPMAHTVPRHICIDWADVDGNNRVEMQDVYYLLAHLYQGGPAPPDYPGVCCK